jgi:hypothetical protein
MGKRGPQPKGEFSGKTQVFSTRIRPDLREAIELAARKSGRSISQEVESRLRRTFIEDDKIEAAFGNRRNYLIMRAAAIAIEWQVHPSRESEEGYEAWLNDPHRFDNVLKTITAVLEKFRPTGEVGGEPQDFRDGEADVWIDDPDKAASEVIEGIRKSDPALPLTGDLQGFNFDYVAGRLKSDLGDLVQRGGKGAQPADERGTKRPKRKGS